MKVRTETWFGVKEKVKPLPIEVGDVIGWVHRKTKTVRLGRVQGIEPAVYDPSTGHGTRHTTTVDPVRLAGRTHRQTKVYGSTHPDFLLRSLPASAFPVSVMPVDRCPKPPEGPVIGVAYIHTAIYSKHNKYIMKSCVLAALGLSDSGFDVVLDCWDYHSPGEYGIFREFYRQAHPQTTQKTMREILNATGFNNASNR